MKKISIILIAILVTLLFSINYSYAAGLTLEVKANKETAQIGDNVEITVDWVQPMQAADYKLKYDSTKLEYVSSSIEETYINKTEKGQISIAWFSSNNADLTNMTFTFKVIEKGTANISVEIDGGFSDGQMKMPESYDVTTKGTKTITLTEKTIQAPNGSENNNSQNQGQNNNQQNEGITNNQQQQSNNGANNQTNKNKVTSGDTTAKTALPKTGDNILVISIIGLTFIILGILFYKINTKYKGI